MCEGFNLGFEIDNLFTQGHDELIGERNGRGKVKAGAEFTFVGTNWDFVSGAFFLDALNIVICKFEGRV